MAVGPDTLPELCSIDGVSIATGSAGIKMPGRADLALFELASSSSVAGVFTQNRFCAAPVQVARDHLAQGNSRYLIINTGNANAGTGADGLAAARATCAAVAQAVGCAPEQVLPFSTGVIGERLPVEKLIDAVPALSEGLAPGHWLDAASAIMTTDTRPKGSSLQFEVGEQTYTVTGIAKGAGMIKPNMATLLAFAATDAAVSPNLLQTLLTEAVENSFNRITVDGDTSTNDACMLVATGARGKGEFEDESAALQALRDALGRVFLELAQAVVRDAEGATKFVAVTAGGGASQAECLQVAYAVAESPLVKTALFASDPNWGRILAAVGYAGIVDLDVNGVSITINGVRVAEQGGLAAGYREADGQAAMAMEDIQIEIDLGRGSARETVWTSDLSHGYVKINAEYRS